MADTSVKPPHLCTEAQGNLLQRYEAGEITEVWRSLRLSPTGGDAREEALDVARATMRRVRRNCEMIAERLEARGWRALLGEFYSTPSRPPWPGQSDVETLAGCSIPVALQAFWEEVGGVDFVWDYNQPEEPPALFPDVPLIDLDPLSIDPPVCFPAILEEWRNHLLDPLELVTALPLDLAPDFYNKANFSGGSPYGIVLPSWGADPTFVTDFWQMPFTAYLRHALHWGGFPGLAEVPLGSVARRRLDDLCEGLEPF